MSKRAPVVGNWYQDAEAGTIFEVVAYDEDDGCVEVQHLDGEVEEFDLDNWRELRLADIAPPEDWRSGFEVSGEDAPDPDAPMHPDDFSGAISHIEPDSPADDDWPE